VHETIVVAFEDGMLERFAAKMKGRSQVKREELLAQVIATLAR